MLRNNLMDALASLDHRHLIRNAEERGVMAQEYCWLPWMGKPQYLSSVGSQALESARCSMLNGASSVYFTAGRHQDPNSHSFLGLLS